MIQDFELQKGDGIAVDLIGWTETEDCWLVVDEEELVKMIQIAFGCEKFTINHLLDVLQKLCEE